MKKILSAAAVCLTLSTVSATASDHEIMVCAKNDAWIAGRMLITLYTGDAETHWSTGWKTLNLGAENCTKARDVRRMNVTIEGLTTKWIKVCDVERKPGESLRVTMNGSLFSQSCDVF